MADEPTVVDPPAVADPVVTEVAKGKSETELAAISESQKYRARAQVAEKDLAERIETEKKAELDRLEADGKIKEKNDLLTKDNEVLKAKADAWESYKASRKEELLKSFPEDKREAYSTFNLEQLEIVAKDLKPEKKVEVNTGVPGSPTMTDTDKAIATLTQQFSENKLTYPAYQTELAKLRAS